MIYTSDIPVNSCQGAGDSRQLVIFYILEENGRKNQILKTYQICYKNEDFWIFYATAYFCVFIQHMGTYTYTEHLGVIS